VSCQREKHWLLFTSVAGPLPIEERTQAEPQLRREVVFLNGVEERHGGLIRAELSQADITAGEVMLEVVLDVGRETMLQIIHEERDDFRAAMHAVAKWLVASGQVGGSVG